MSGRYVGTSFDAVVRNHDNTKRIRKKSRIPCAEKKQDHATMTDDMQ